MIRIFPDFSVQVTASAGGGPGGGGSGGGGGGMVTGPPVGRVPVPVPGATNGNPQSVQGIGGYPQRYLWSRSAPAGTPAGLRSRSTPLLFSLISSKSNFSARGHFYLRPPDPLIPQTFDSPSRCACRF